MTDTGKTLTKSVSLPLAAVGGIAIKSSIDFESAFAGVRKTVDATEEEFAALEQGIRNMAKELPASAEEIAGVTEAAGQLGIQKEALLEFTKVMIDLGEATNLTAEEAATQLARFANIVGMSQSEFDRLGSVIVDLGNNMATTEAEIVEMGMRLASAGSQIGLTEDQILALAAALSSVGLEAAGGGTAFSRVMIDMANAVAEPGEKLELLAQVAGVTAEEFARAFSETPAEAIQMFISGLNKMSQEGENVFAVLDNLEMSDIRVRDSLLRAAGASDVFSEALEIGSNAWKENTALTNEANQRYATTESQLKMLFNRLKDVAITLGDALAPALMAALDAMEPLFKMVENVANWFVSLDENTQKAIMTIGGIAVAIGPVLTIFGKLSSGIGGVINAFGKVSGAFTSAGNTMLSGIGSAGVWGLAIAGIVGAVTPIIKNWDSISEFFKNLWDKVTDVFSNAWNFIKDGISNMWNTITNFFQNGWNSIKSGVQTFSDNVSSAFSNVWDGVKNGVSNMWDTVSNAFQNSWDRVKGGVNNFANNVGSVFSKTWDGIKNGCSNMWDKITGVFKKGGKDSEEIVEGSNKNIQNSFQELSDEVVGHSIIPEMVQYISYWLERGAVEGETAIDTLRRFGIRALGDLKAQGVNSIESLSALGVASLDALYEMGARSLEDLKSFGIKNIQDLKKIGVTNFEELSKIGIKSLEDLNKIGIKTFDDLNKIGIKDLKDLNKIGIKSFDDLNKIGIKDLKDLNKVGVSSLQDLQKLGINSLKDLNKYGLTNIESLKNLGITNLQDLKVYGIQNLQELESLGITGLQNFAVLGGLSFEDLKNLGISDLQELSNVVQRETQRWQSFTDGTISGIRSSFESNFLDFLEGTKSFSEAFTGFMGGIGDAILENLVKVAGSALADSLRQFASWAVEIIAKTAPAIVALMQQFYATLLAFYAWSGPLAPALAAGTIAAGLAGLAALVGKVMANIVGLAEGGIVTKPTFAMIGEAGPEAVIPLSNRSFESGNETIININGPLSNIEYVEVINDADVEMISRKLAFENEKVIRALGRRYAW